MTIMIVMMTTLMVPRKDGDDENGGADDDESQAIQQRTRNERLRQMERTDYNIAVVSRLLQKGKSELKRRCQPTGKTQNDGQHLGGGWSHHHRRQCDANAMVADAGRTQFRKSLTNSPRARKTPSRSYVRGDHVGSVVSAQPRHAHRHLHGGTRNRRD